MKMRPHCFLRPILRPAAVFALAFGVSSLMLSAQDEDAALDADEVVAEAAEAETTPDDEQAAEADAEAEETGDDAETEEGSDDDAEIEEEPVLSGEELEVTAEAEADLIQGESEFNELLAQAITRRNEKEFIEAFLLFDEAKKVIDKCEVSPAKAVFEKRLADERKIAQILYGNELLEKAEQDYNKLLLLTHTDEILEIGMPLLDDLAYANAMYYLGTLPGQPYEKTDLQVAIANDPQKGKHQFAATVEAMSKTIQERIDSQKFWDESTNSQYSGTIKISKNNRSLPILSALDSTNTPLHLLFTNRSKFMRANFHI